MKTQLIMLDTPIIVSDEKIEKGNFTYKQEINTVIEVKEKPTSGNWGKKIIAGLPELPQIDFNGFEEQLGIVNVEKLAIIEEDKIYKDCDPLDPCGYSGIDYREGFIEGFKAAQKLNKKNNILEDLNVLLHSKKHCFTFPEGFREFQKSLIDYLSQPKVFDIEVEMEDKGGYRQDSMNGCWISKLVPKITDNSIKIIKIL